ncbi:TPA: type III-A CRISPR-associated protein Cas10/Csm1 [candidate division WOR-3]|uniref:CRISPR system single-strand-specific deoxyribonuclease Cas10/Csm1 (subtype III-A) n=1 Tax=candidate division WOR-3 bacterium TaxID=2052148 RepID=A0A348MLJ5_UNCW3|nr:type III-A CRISPR-associated protein Cas10/Csm1 [candidate division WOR-3 bacterium]HCP16377.1 type III-A CRISPR-associated protein Cas10/Csm1 [candidate division WOR-3 bacterium]
MKKNNFIGVNMNKKVIYISSLLHDLGKFLERSKQYVNNYIKNKYSDIRYSHPRYSKFFVEQLSKKIDWLSIEEWENISKIVGYHHQPNDFDTKIIQLADWLASAEREEQELEEFNYINDKLESIFSNMSDYNEQYEYDISVLNFDNMMPMFEFNCEINRYIDILSKFLEDIGKVRDEEEVLFILEKYCSYIPAQTRQYRSDISLYDHSKLTAAIAICLFNENKNGFIDNAKIDKIIQELQKMMEFKKFNKDQDNSDFKENLLTYLEDKLLDEHFILIKGDISGIQKFIFNVPSKKAAKSLKGRSIYIMLLTQLIAQYIIDQLNLTKSNILYCGGGNFYILSHKSAENKLKEIEKRIMQLLFKHHEEKLSCNIGYVSMKIGDFLLSEKIWKESSNEVNRKKLTKFNYILKEDFNKLFLPTDISKSIQTCDICKMEIKEKSTEKESDSLEIVLCDMCNSFISLADESKNAKSIIISKKTNSEDNKNTYKSIFNELGYDIKFSNDSHSSSNLINVYKINDFDSNKWILGSFYLPNKTFDDLADKNKIAYLKLDVDNLGTIFGKVKNPSLSRISTLSRQLNLFFEYYLIKLVEKENLQEDLYIVFSGGDDVLVIGRLKKLFDFSLKLREKFKIFTAENPNLTFSAALGVFDVDFPVINAIYEMEHLLKKSKSIIYYDEKDTIKIPRKNKITIFNQPFSWKELEYIKELYDKLYNFIDQNKENKRSILRKILLASEKYNPLIDGPKGNEINNQKIWKMRYYLRNIKDKKNLKQKEEIIDIYEKMWLKNYYFSDEKPIKNHQILNVAAKILDLEIRKK